MGSEITGLDDRHAYLKLGNDVARFAFDYLDLPTQTPGFIPPKSPDGEMSFDPDTLEKRPAKSDKRQTKDAPTETVKPIANDAPLALEKNPIPSPRKDASASPNAGDANRSEHVSSEVAVLPDASTDAEELHGPEYVREL